MTAVTSSVRTIGIFCARDPSPKQQWQSVTEQQCDGDECVSERTKHTPIKRTEDEKQVLNALIVGICVGMCVVRVSWYE